LFERWNETLQKHRVLTGAALILVTFVVYAGALANDFCYDDGQQILTNSFVLNPHLWKRIFTGSVWSFQGGSTNFYRPLQFVCYWLTYRIAGHNPAAFHLVNLLVYVATVWLVYRIARELFRHEFAALLGALLWALHPQHVEPVAWISALPDVGAAFFYLLALLLFLRAEQRLGHKLPAHGVAALVYFPALFFKEMALSLPLLLLVYWLVLAPPEPWRKRLIRWAPYVLTVGLYVAIRMTVMGSLTQTRFWNLTGRVVGAAFGLLGQHARLFFWPVQLNDFRTFHLGESLHSLWPWLMILLVLAALWFRKREPRLSFFVIWWLVAILPCLDVRQLSTPFVADRFSLLPSVGLCLAIAYVFVAWLPARVPSLLFAPVALAVLGLVMCFWTVQTVQAIPRWHDNETLVEYSYRQVPNQPLLRYSRALVLQYRHGRLDEALQEYQEALRLDQRTANTWRVGVDYLCYVGMAQIAYQRGNADEAIKYYEKAVRASDNNSAAYDGLGSVYFPRGDYARAAEYFGQALKANPYDLGAHFYLGTCWLKLGRYAEAAEQFRTARNIDPGYLQAYEAEACALEAAGDAAGAARVRGEMPKP
jgi:tetratricopeptide (TPR) repeat protein